MNPNFETQNPKRILVRGVNWLGDAVMTIPGLLRLRERFAKAHVTLLTPAKLAELWPHCPAVDETIAFAQNDSVFSISRKVREGKFDLSLVLPNSPRSALEVWLARIPQRVGYARPWRNLFLTRAVPPRSGAVQMRKRSTAEIEQLVSTGHRTRNTEQQIPVPAAHQIHDYLHLAAALGANPEPLSPRMLVTPEEIETTKRKFSLDTVRQPIFGMNPGAEYGPAKRWPIERFIAAAREIQKRTGCLWLIFGGKGDAEIARRIESETRDPRLEIRNLAGQTSLSELMVLLKLCRVLLTNDSGPMHLAAAFGTPVVVPFGSTSPELTGPGYAGAERNRVLTAGAPCSPCFLRDCPIDFRCMNGISVERVIQAVVELGSRS